MSIVDQIAGGLGGGATPSASSSAAGGSQQLAQAFQQLCMTIGEEGLGGIQKIGQELISNNQQLFSDDDNSNS